MADLELKCACGEVEGKVVNASYASVNRCVCYCDDCQTFASALGAEGLTNEQGGSDIVQVRPGSLSITKGHDKIALMRLSPKGLMRWHTSCCQTPIGNTMASTNWWAFVGVPTPFISTPDLDSVVGPPRAGIQGKFAKNPETVDAHQTVSMGVGFRVITWVAGNKLSGGSKSCYFDDAGKPVAEARVLTKEERKNHKPSHS